MVIHIQTKTQAIDEILFIAGKLQSAAEHTYNLDGTLVSIMNKEAIDDLAVRLHKAGFTLLREMVQANECD